jgi:1,4-dihydroxy-2-naphthoyl-CoA hydrolase
VGRDGETRSGQDQAAGTGQDGAADPGPDRSADPGPDRSADPGPDRSADPGQDRSADPGQDRSADPGQDRSADPGPDRSADPGQDRSADPGQDRSADPGQDRSAQIIEGFAQLSEGTLPGRMGITVSAARAEQVVGSMPVDGNIQPYGLLHGGASCVLAETLGSLGAALHAGPGRFAVGIEISATHHRAVTGGVVTGVATRVHGGRTTATYEIAISDDRGRRACSARLTCLLRDQVPAGGHNPGDITTPGK